MLITLNNELIANPISTNNLSSKLLYALREHTKSNATLKAIDDIPETLMRNSGLVGMLSAAYKNHLNVALTPQDFWIVLISEIAKEVNTHSKDYQSLFTQSNEKELISISSGSMTHIPITQLSEALSKKVLFDSSLLFPHFSTNTLASTEVIQAMFCDMASPYYDYGMFCCGIPAIKLLGTQEDWVTLQTAWNKLIGIFETSSMKAYGDKVNSVLEKINATFIHPEMNINFWKDIFTQKNVGSGGDLTIDGWITELFITKHKFAKITHFTATHGIVHYTQLQTEQEFYRIDGGFQMEQDPDGFYQLQYNNYVFEKIQ